MAALICEDRRASTNHRVTGPFIEYDFHFSLASSLLGPVHTYLDMF